MSRFNWPTRQEEWQLEIRADQASSEKDDITRLFATAFSRLTKDKQKEVMDVAERVGYSIDKEGAITRVKPYRPVLGIEY
ncbi:hypothetical protein HY639_01075 [Candidatus Woesearchaeota archaeon]|nr:hypothetical protein [Candidatus Woesearchaeota archaeon]